MAGDNFARAGQLVKMSAQKEAGIFFARVLLKKGCPEEALKLTPDLTISAEPDTFYRLWLFKPVAGINSARRAKRWKPWLSASGLLMGRDTSRYFLMKARQFTGC